MITREKHTVSGSFFSIKINKAELFEEIKKRSALFAKNKKREDGTIDYEGIVITDDEQLYFDTAFKRLATLLANEFKGNGLDRNDLVPIYSRSIYLYQTVNETEKNGTIEGDDPDAVFIIIDNGKVGQNSVSILDDQLWEFSTHYAITEIYGEMAPEFTEQFGMKAIQDKKQFLSTLFYFL